MLPIAVEPTAQRDPPLLPSSSKNGLHSPAPSCKTAASTVQLSFRVLIQHAGHSLHPRSHVVQTANALGHICVPMGVLILKGGAARCIVVLRRSQWHRYSTVILSSLSKSATCVHPCTVRVNQPTVRRVMCGCYDSDAWRGLRTSILSNYPTPEFFHF